MEDIYNKLALFSSSTNEVRITILTKIPIMYPIISLIDTGAAQNVSNAIFIRLQENSCVGSQVSPNRQAADEQLLTIICTINSTYVWESFALEYRAVSSKAYPLICCPERHL